MNRDERVGDAAATNSVLQILRQLIVDREYIDVIVQTPEPRARWLYTNKSNLPLLGVRSIYERWFIFKKNIQMC